MKDIFRILEKSYIYELFEKKKLVYFPETENKSSHLKRCEDKKITLIEIEKNSPDWAKETCLAKYKIFFEDETYKVVRGTASVSESKEKAWQIMNFLYGQGFDEGGLLIARPLDFIKDANLLLYEEAQGTPLSLIIQDKNSSELEGFLERTAEWLAKLHGCNFKKETDFPPAVFIKKNEYSKIFAQIINLIPGLRNVLVFNSELEFIDEISDGQKTLIHNDFYPGNIIVGQEIIYGIDFEKSGFGLRLMDVATFLGWFDFPQQIREANFSEKEISNFQNIFLAAYCRSCRLERAEIERTLNKYLAKIFLDQVYNYAIIYVKGRNYFSSEDKINYERKIKALVQKVRQHF
ncbi:aminoglycoside phosphotransferase family protein [Patescibacteria group bacterium]|nr:aminoglycoside phosphotransferase family protein [Patescibacteria group bacterium]